VTIAIKLITNRISFGSHVKTVRDYLDWYRKNNDTKKRSEASSKFSEYLISACWRKMARRIGHWGSVGLIYNLTHVNHHSLVRCAAQLNPLTIAKNSDFKLSMYLRDMEKTIVLETVLSFHKYDIPSDAILPSKDDSTKAKIVLPCLQRLCHGDDPCSLYNKETVLEFHHLLVATMLYYARNLRQLRQEQKAKLEKDKEIPKPDECEKSITTPSSLDEGGKQTSPDDAISDAAFILCFLTRLLNAIVISGAFQTHIKLLVNHNLLSIPHDRVQGIFEKFAADKEIPWQQSRCIQTKAAKGSDGSDSSGNPDSKDAAKGSDGSDSSGNPDSKDATDSEDVIEDVTNDQDPFQVLNRSELFPYDEISMAIQGWVKLFVQHFHAKRILESFARSAGTEIPIEIKVLSVNWVETRHFKMPTWEDLREVLRSSLHDRNTEVQDEMIKVFQDHFQTAGQTDKTQTDRNGSPPKHAIYSVFSDIITQRAKGRPRYYNMHCEVALASLVAASRDPAKVSSYVDEEVINELAVGLIPFVV
jgi:hypothetical protein